MRPKKGAYCHIIAVAGEHAVCSPVLGIPVTGGRLALVPLPSCAHFGALYGTSAMPTGHIGSAGVWAGWVCQGVPCLIRWLTTRGTSMGLAGFLRWQIKQQTQPTHQQLQPLSAGSLVLPVATPVTQAGGGERKGGGGGGIRSVVLARIGRGRGWWLCSTRKRQCAGGRIIQRHEHRPFEVFSIKHNTFL